MIIIAISIVIAVLIILSAVTVFLLFHFGLINSYHPVKRAKHGQIKVACVGDSITYGCMVKNRRKNNYPAVLNRLLGENYCVINFGYTNRTVIKIADLPYVNEKLYKKSLDFNPDVVFILLGSNDSKEKNWNKEKFFADYGEIIDSYSALKSSPKIYILIPPPVFKAGKKVFYKLRKDVIDNEICPYVKQIAETKGIEAVDIHRIFENRKELFADGVHPNSQGSKLLAQKLFVVLKNGYVK